MKIYKEVNATSTDRSSCVKWILWRYMIMTQTYVIWLNYHTNNVKRTLNHVIIFCVDGLHISVSSTIRTHKNSNHRLATTSRNLDALILVLYLVTCKITINCIFRNIPDKKHSLSCKTKRKKVNFILTDNQNKNKKTTHTYIYIFVYIVYLGYIQ